MEAAVASNNHVTFRGTDTTSAGGWYGIWFQDDQATDTLGVNQSDLSYTDFWTPKFAVGVDSLSGDIIHCTFNHSEDADIYVAGDTRIPVGYQWILDAPTSVVVADSDASANWGLLEEDSTRVEIRVEGLLQTTGTSSDSVWFKSDAGSPASDDWYGLIGYDGTLSLDHADIGYATNSVFWDGCSTAKLWNSTVHDFRDTAVLDYVSGAWIKDSVIDGAAGPNPQQGRVGIHIVDSVPRVEGTTVDWSSAGGSNAYGMEIEYSKTNCGLSGSDTLRVLSNNIVGDGAGAGTENTGLFVYSGCDRHHPQLDKNNVSEWSDYGVKLEACAATKVTCNDVFDNQNGVYYTRTSAAAGDSVTFYQNQLEYNASRNLKTDAPYKLLLRKAGGDGKNEFRADTTGMQAPKNIETTDAALTIPAQVNLWADSSGVVTDSTSIAATITGAGAVDFSNPLASVTGTCQTGVPPGALAEMGAGQAPDRAPEAPRLQDDLPRSFALPPTAPNPLRSATEIEYHVPVGYAGRINLTVYDVTGRRVKTLVDGVVPPGRYRAVWDGRDSAGSRAVAGIYFVHLRAAGYEATRKVVYIR